MECLQNYVANNKYNKGAICPFYNDIICYLYNNKINYEKSRKNKYAY